MPTTTKYSKLEFPILLWQHFTIQKCAQLGQVSESQPKIHNNTTYKNTRPKAVALTIIDNDDDEGLSPGVDDDDDVGYHDGRVCR